MKPTLFPGSSYSFSSRENWNQKETEYFGTRSMLTVIFIQTRVSQMIAKGCKHIFDPAHC